MHPLSRSTPLLTLVGALLLSVPAAADDKIYPGTVCRPLHPYQTNLSDLVYASSDGSILNDNIQGNIDIVCPVTRDNTTSATALNSARVDVEGNGFTFACTFYAVDNNSTSSFNVPRSTSVVGFTSMTYTSLAGAADWMVFLYCGLPREHAVNGRAALRTIKTSEP